MIEVWVEAGTGEAFLCEPGRIQLHINSGTISASATLLTKLPTNSMSEAQKMLNDSLEDDAEVNEDLFEEGYD